MTRTGSVWDLLAAAAVLAPLASLASRRWAAAGPLVSLAAWIVLLAAHAAPEVGRYAPDQLALAASAGVVLVAAALLERSVSATRAQSLGPLAAALCFAIGLVERPDLGSGAATALVVAAGVAAAGVAVAPPAARLLLPVALHAGFRGVAELVDPASALGLGLGAVAVALVLPARIPGRGRLPAAEPAALALAALAAAIGPVPAVRPGGLLLAAAAVLVAAAPDRRGWPVLAAAPGAGLVAASLADVPSSGSPSVPAHLAFAALAVLVAAALVAHIEAPGEAREHRSTPVTATVAALVGWLVVAPGSWRWAEPAPGLLSAWDRAAGVAAAVAVAAGVALAASVVVRDRSPSDARR